ncbi:hypothetical protein V6Z11_D08G145500 [Gossypium hirsutum]
MQTSWNPISSAKITACRHALASAITGSAIFSHGFSSPNSVRIIPCFQVQEATYHSICQLNLRYQFAVPLLPREDI